VVSLPSRQPLPQQENSPAFLVPVGHRAAGRPTAPGRASTGKEAAQQQLCDERSRLRGERPLPEPLLFHPAEANTESLKEALSTSSTCH